MECSPCPLFAMGHLLIFLYNESVNPLQDARLSVQTSLFSFYILIPAVRRPNDLIDRGSCRTRIAKQNKLTLNDLSI